jgi:hypothetical protein
MDIQPHIPAVLCTIHNFMRRTNSDIFDLALEYGHDLAEDDGVGSGVQLEGPADAAERRRADVQTLVGMESRKQCGLIILQNMHKGDSHCHSCR